MRMVEQEQSHRIEMEIKEHNAEVADVRMGKIIGSLMTLTAIVAAVYTVHIGAHWMVSVSIVSVPITALIGRFIKNRH